MKSDENTLRRVLIVDDEPSVRSAIQMMLKYYGYNAQAVDSGDKALALCETNRFDLVITDYMMPEMNGGELAFRIKQRWPKQKIIMVTAFAEDFLADSEHAGLLDCVLSKPFSLAELHAAISRVLAKQG